MTLGFNGQSVRTNKNLTLNNLAGVLINKAIFGEVEIVPEGPFGYVLINGIFREIRKLSLLVGGEWLTVEELSVAAANQWQNY